MNTETWLTGVYVQQAIMSVFSKGCEYPKKPMPLTEAEREQDGISTMKAKMESFAVRFNQKFLSQEVK